MAILTAEGPHRGRLRPAAVLLLWLLVPGTAGAGSQVSDVELKAAFVYNFAKFTEWPALREGEAIAICVMDDDRLAATLGDVTRGQRIDTHPIEVRRIAATVGPPCHVLFVSGQSRDGAAVLRAVDTKPTLTVGDTRQFAAGGGMIELFVEGDRMRFAVNVNAVRRAHLKLSSRLLSLAKIVSDDHAP